MKTTLLTILYVLLGFSAYSQLGSVTVSAAFTTNPAVTVGLDPLAATEPVFQVKVGVNDLTQVGVLTVKVYDTATDNYAGIQQFTQAEISDGSMLESGLLVYSFGLLDPAGSFRIVTEAQNLEMGYLEPVITFYPIH